MSLLQLFFPIFVNTYFLCIFYIFSAKGKYSFGCEAKLDSGHVYGIDGRRFGAFCIPEYERYSHSFLSGAQPHTFGIFLQIFV